MAVTLVVEDGSGKTDSNTYIDLAYLADFDIDDTLASLTEPQKNVLIIKAAREVESYRLRFKGRKASEDQAMQWPRYDVYIDCYYIGSDEIPKELKDAQAQFAIDAYSSGDLKPNGDNQQVIEERIEGAITVKYSESGANTSQPVFYKALDLLMPVLCNSGGYTVARG